MESGGCRILNSHDVDEAARVISEAFIDDPLCAFMLPRRRTRTRTLYKFFRPYTEVNVKNKRGFGYGQPLEGVAFWIAPGQEGLSINIRSLPNFLPLLISMYPIGYIRAKSILARIDELHVKHAVGPHFYLDNIGVLESARGKGTSSKLIRPFLEKADSQGTFAYTDTVTRENVSLYEHFGFECVEEAPVGNSGVTVWALRRGPDSKT